MHSILFKENTSFQEYPANGQNSAVIFVRIVAREAHFEYYFCVLYVVKRLDFVPLLEIHPFNRQG